MKLLSPTLLFAACLYTCGAVQATEPTVSQVQKKKADADKGKAKKSDKTKRDNLVRILVIDGQPRTKFFVDETSYLMAFFGVIAEKDDVRHRYKVVRLLDLQLSKAAADLIDIVILCNVEAISESNARLLHDIVARGGAVMVFLGNKVDPKLYNERLYRKGEGLLPAELTDHEFVKSAKPKFLEGKLAQLKYPTNALPDFRRLYGVNNAIKRGVRVVATVEDKPLLLVKKLGKGRCVMFTSTIDLAWNTVARHPLFVVLMLESIRYARGDAIRRSEPRKDN